MLNKFKNIILKLLEESDHSKILLAVSGGIDSMVMLDLFIRSDIDIDIAHCNFQLRGKESDGDEKFVIEKAEQENITYHINRFETKEYADQNGISIQMAARDLRYEWFHELIKSYQYQKLALAHNLDDKVETFMINLIRGTGLKGITGMKEKKKDIIRPLLFFSRNEIENYALENNIKYREDSSNQSTKYLRNKIRHEIIPVLKEYEPSFLKIMNDNMFRFNEAWQVYNDYFEKEKKNLVETNNNIIRINIDKFKKIPHMETFAYELLTPYNFSHTTISNILRSLDNQSGLRFLSSTHRCVKDRNYLIINRNQKSPSKKFYIDNETIEIMSPLRLQFEYVFEADNFQVEKNKMIAQLDFDKLTFPLILRKWQAGDYFQPLGMTGYKKLSDFFIDNKFSIPEKEDVWILTSGEKIAWIVGYRIDERFKVTSETKNILIIRK